MSNTHHSSPLEEARRLLAELIPHAEAAVIGLSANPSWRQRLDVFASDRGFAADPGGDLTIARQAALLELLIMLKLELNGERDDSTAKKRARVQAKPQSLLSSLNALDQERYSMDPLTEIIEVAATPSALDVSELTTALSAANYEDVIGPIYEEVVPQAERRKLGQFWTPRPIADLMARWCIRSTTARVLDPASGSGALLLAS
jgi:hypothetical protein